MSETTEEKTTELTEEVEEKKEAIEEKTEELADAKKAGDTDRVAKLETEVAGMRTDLGTVLTQLEKIANRPIHPAPQSKAPETPADATPGKAAGTETATDDKKPAKKGRTANRGWFKDRAEYDD